LARIKDKAKPVIEKYSGQITPAIIKQTNDTIAKTRGTAK
jgi:hypothetical protein